MLHSVAFQGDGLPSFRTPGALPRADMFWPFQGGKTACAPFREPKQRNIKKRQRGRRPRLIVPRSRFGLVWVRLQGI
jgi:hypothetical protein